MVSPTTQNTVAVMRK
nr:unnamed protein product [Callosobruchus chinensis]CAH7766131.1 unnamed protein product [Callosobruchus chinensis]